MSDVRVGGSNPSLVPDPNITPRDYPKNPAPMASVDGRPAAGQPMDVPTISQGIQLLSACSICGVSYPPDQMGAHQRDDIANQGMFDVDSGSDDDYTSTVATTNKH